MLRWIISTSLRLRLAVLAVTVLLVIAGTRLARTTPLDVFPEFSPPFVEIQTEAPGLSTADVEGLITVPLESALNGVPALAKIRSKSVLGLSSVVLIFAEGTDLLRARQLVQERLLRVAVQLPAAARTPVMLAPLSSLSRVMKIGVSSRALSQVELTTLTKWTIRPRLMAVPGVANVAIWGERDRQLQVLVDPSRLRAHNVSVDDVIGAVREATSFAAGGFLDTPNQRLPVTHLPSIASVSDLGRAIIPGRLGTPLRIGDVADVVEGFPPPIGDAVINDGPGLLLVVEKQLGGNTLQVTRDVEAALDALRPGLQGVDIDPTIFRPATFIEMALHNLNVALLIGCVLVTIVLVAFLYEWRTALISIVAIPLSLLAAALALRYRGGTIDTMVLAGLIIALGEVVDDAIIGVENIVRRLRLNRMTAQPRPAHAVVLDASLEVRSAVVYGSLIVILVFLPVFLLDGLAGSFFRPLALSYVLAIAASLAVAITVTPAMALVLLPGAAERKESPLVRRLKGGFRRILPRLVDRPWHAILIVAVALVAAGVTVPLLGEEFLPNFKEYDFLMHWVEKPGTSLDAMRRITVRASRELRSIPGVRNFGAHIGRAEVADEVVGPNFTELWISVDPKVDYGRTVARIQELVEGYPGLYRDLLTYLRERIKEVLTGSSATVVLRLYGPDLEKLRNKAAEVGTALASVPGVVDLKVQPQVLVPQVQVAFRSDHARQIGIGPGQVRHLLTLLVHGEKVGEFYEAQKTFDVVVWGAPETRDSISSIRALPIHLPGGGYVPLGEVADVTIVPTPNEITREGGSRRLDVTCNVRGRDLGSVARDIREQMKGIAFDAGYHPEVLGESAAREESRNRLLLLWAYSLVGILLVLYVDFGSPRLTLLVFFTLPFALIGGVAGALMDGAVLSLGSLVGFVTVLGIAARNGIMLVSHYRHLELQENEPFGRNLVLRGTEERLAPILMTAFVTGLALVPIIVGGSRSGHEIEHPMAVVILGGLVTSTVLNLFLLPSLYLRFGRTSSSLS